MASVLPSIVAVLFLACGLAVIATQGFSRVTASFLGFCLTTCVWQACWAVMLQIQNEPDLALLLARVGYLQVIFLPTCLYQCLTEISGRHEERRWVYLSYGVAAVLGFLDLFTQLIVSGTYHYYFGLYPKAGVLHPFHLLQTGALVARGLFLTFNTHHYSSKSQRHRLQLCGVSLLVFVFAAVDYLCNYGVEFFPPGILFISISLGLMTYAVTKWGFIEPLVAAATVAHEVRTPLARIGMQADYLQQHMPDLLDGYRAAVSHGLVANAVEPGELQKLDRLFLGISQQVDRCNTVIDMLLASIKADRIDVSSFDNYRISEVMQEALDGFPFTEADRQRIRVEIRNDFEFHGSRTMLVFVLFNLIKNALYAITLKKQGEIELWVQTQGVDNVVQVRDTGPGISAQTLPKIFDNYFTTKGNAGLGIGLPFCRRVIRSFGGDLHCESREGEYTLFTLRFPPLAHTGATT